MPLVFLHLAKEESYHLQVYGARGPMTYRFIGFEDGVDVIRPVKFLAAQVSFLHLPSDIVVDYSPLVFAIGIVKLYGIVVIQFAHVDELRNGLVTILVEWFTGEGRQVVSSEGVIEFDAVQFVLRKHKFPVKPADSQRFYFFGVQQ